MKNFLVLTILFSAILNNSLLAQTDSDEAGIKALTEKFVAAYNSEDVETLKSLYREDAVRIDSKGNELKGADQIAAYFKDQFIKNKTTLTVNHEGISWSDYQHAFLARGTYEVKGAQIIYDIPIHNTGSYENTMLKGKDGHWKIAKSVLTAQD